MKRPFEFIEYKTDYRKQFRVTDGRQPTYALIYLKEGSFSLSIGGEQQIVKKGDCAIFSDDINFFRSVIEPISFVYLQFTVNPSAPFSLPLPYGKVEFSNKARFIDSITAYESLEGSTDPRVIYYREHLLEDILLQAFSEHNTELIAKGESSDETAMRLRECHDPIVNGAVDFIRQNLRDKLSVSDICRAVGTNQSTLNFRFRRELSLSVGQFVTAERMKNARRLLENTTYSVSEIAARCGFDNVYYFSNAFKLRCGCTPSRYRKKFR